MEVRSNGRKVQSSGMEVRSNGIQVAIRLHFCPQCPSIQNPPSTSSPRAQGLVNSGPVSGAFPRICCSTNVLPHFPSAFFASSILFFFTFSFTLLFFLGPACSHAGISLKPYAPTHHENQSNARELHFSGSSSRIPTSQSIF